MLLAPKQLGDGEQYNSVEQNGRLQLQNIVDAIEKHFRDVEIGYTQIKQLNQPSYIVSEGKIR